MLSYCPAVQSSPETTAGHCLELRPNICELRRAVREWNLHETFKVCADQTTPRPAALGPSTELNRLRRRLFHTVLIADSTRQEGKKMRDECQMGSAALSISGERRRATCFFTGPQQQLQGRHAGRKSQFAAQKWLLNRNVSCGPCLWLCHRG